MNEKNFSVITRRDFVRRAACAAVGTFAMTSAIRDLRFMNAAVAQSNALLPSGEFISATFDANVYTDAVPSHVKQIGDAMVKLVDGSPVYIRDVADVLDGGAAPTQTVSVNGSPR